MENAVKHGIRQEHALLRIVIRTCKTAECSHVVIEDSGPGCEPDPESRAVSCPEDGTQSEQERDPHVGLNNVRDRLEIICGGRLDIAPRPGGGTIVTVSIPDPQLGPKSA